MGVYDFGLTSEQFWALTPPQYAALAERHDHATEQDEYRAGIVASTIANTNRGKDTKPFLPQMFMRNYEPSEESSTSGEMSGGDILGFMMNLFPPPPEVREKILEDRGG